MSNEAENITRVNGYMVVCELEDGGAKIDSTGHTLKDVAHWLIENVDYYPSNNEMFAIETILLDGGAASVELETKSGQHTLTVIHSKGTPRE